MVQHNGTEEGTWQYQVKCSDFPIEIVIGSTVGGFFAVCLVLLVSAVVVINVNDWRQYQNYLKNKESNLEQLEKNTNPLFEHPNKKIENPAYESPAYEKND